jgi:hypothetical protein
MAIRAISYRKWCGDNISPQCWPRILLKSMNTLRAEGLQLKDMEDPADDFILSEPVTEALNKALLEIYDLEIEKAALEA